MVTGKAKLSSWTWGIENVSFFTGPDPVMVPNMWGQFFQQTKEIPEYMKSSLTVVTNQSLSFMFLLKSGHADIKVSILFTWEITWLLFTALL